LVGRVARPHGIRGEMKMVEGEGSSGAWRTVKELFLGKSPEQTKRFAVRSVRGKDVGILALDGVDRIEEAKELRGQNVYVLAEALPPLEEGVFYAGLLIGAEVFDRQGRRLGKLKEIFDNGAHEIYVIGSGRREILLPVVEGVVLEVDSKDGRLVVDPPPGLPGLEGLDRE
jgi:16S rRNA processing protein RimM